jgi:hypothetical protein
MTRSPKGAIPARGLAELGREAIESLTRASESAQRPVRGIARPGASPPPAHRGHRAPRAPRLREIARELSGQRRDRRDDDASLGEPAQSRVLGARRESAACVDHHLHLKLWRGRSPWGRWLAP